jgi:hypothetical protein
VAPTKSALAAKTTLHLIHGLDVARLVLQVTENFTPRQRWLVTDMRVYDWHELVLALDRGDDAPTRRRWLAELLLQHKSRSLPRDIELEAERALDSREVWRHFAILPTESLYC